MLFLKTLQGLLFYENITFFTMKYYLIFALILLAAACKTDRPPRPSATGHAGELLVVMNRAQYDGQAGEAVRDVFQAQVPMVLAFEPMFDLVPIPTENFVKMFETHRHIFIAEISEEHPKATMEISRDLWSYPQMVIRVKAPNDSIFRRVLEVNAQSFIDHYISVERERVINANMRMPNIQAQNVVREVFGYEMAIPEGYFVAARGDDFVWVRRTGTRDDLEMGVMIATLPYTGPDYDFNHDRIRARRDSLTRKYIPGQFEGSFMTTYAELVPQFREVNFNGHYAVEARSLWRVEGDFMGGPFINYTLVDQARNRLVILDGFVYAPNFDKRDYLRQLEALIYSLSFTEKKEETATN